MPRLTRKFFSYRLHARSGQAVVTVDGRDHYLYPHSSEESRAKHDGLIAAWLAGGRRMPTAPTVPSAVITVSHVIVLQQGQWSKGLVVGQYSDSSVPGTFVAPRTFAAAPRLAPDTVLPRQYTRAHPITQSRPAVSL